MLDNLGALIFRQSDDDSKRVVSPPEGLLTIEGAGPSGKVLLSNWKIDFHDS